MRTRLYFTSVSGNLQVNFLVILLYFLADVRVFGSRKLFWLAREQHVEDQNK